MPLNKLKTSAPGIEALVEREALINGLYDDVSAYATFGIGHVVHDDKSSSLLLAAAQEHSLCLTCVKKKRAGTPSELTFLDCAAAKHKDFASLRQKALEKAAESLAASRYGKTFKSLTAADRATVAKAAAAAVDRECALLTTPARDVFAEDLRPYEQAVNSSVTAVALLQDEFDALVSFTFNVGAGAFKRSTLLKKVNTAKRVASEIEAAFLAWNKSNKKEIPGLTRRRQAEAAQFLGARKK